MTPTDRGARYSAVAEAAAENAENAPAVLEAEDVAVAVAVAVAGVVGAHAEVDAGAAVTGPVAGAAGVDMMAQRVEGKLGAAY
jgi:hypothetical protein